jgi:hypothetical protein
MAFVTTTVAAACMSSTTTVAAAMTTGNGSVTASTTVAPGEAAPTASIAATTTSTTAGIATATASIATTTAMIATAAGEGTITPFMSAIAVVATEAMAAPAMVVAPAKPRPDAEEDPVVVIFRPPETIGSTGIGRVIVISILAYGRRPTNYYGRRPTNLDPNSDLCGSRCWRKCKKHRQQGAEG